MHHHKYFLPEFLLFGVILQVIFFIIPIQISAQTLKYDVIKGNKTIGNMQVKRLRNADTVQYNIVSQVEFKLLLSFKIDYNLQEIFIDGILVNGSATSWLNGRVQKQSAVKKDETAYKINVDNDLSELTTDGIVLSIPKLYFDRPEGHMEIFSQQFAGHLKMSKKSEDIYELVSPDGKNTYTYENGICRQVKVYRTYANFSFKLVGIVTE